MKSLFRQNSIFIALSLLLALSMGLALVLVPKGELHLWLCDRHTPARDIFYTYYTTVAEWFPYVVCVLLLLFGRVGDGVMASACMAGTALTTQLFKHIINAPRPVTWFAQHLPDIQLPLVEGVRMNHWYSFPSGHTTSFFALAFVACILLTSNPKISRIPGSLVQILLFALAALGGYSRIYLSQHFTADVLAGLVVGMAIPTLIWVLFRPLEAKKWYKMHFFEKKV